VVKEPLYDSRETIGLLATALHENVGPDKIGDHSAGNALLDDLLALNGKTRAAISVAREGVVQIQIGSRRVWVTRGNSDGLVVVSDRSDLPARVERIHFDPVSRRFEGNDADPDVAPIPGQPHPRRSALAVVVEAALRHGDLLPTALPV